MARVNKKTELLSHLRSVLALVPATSSAAATTVTAAVAVGAATLTVAAITNIAVGDEIALGTGENKEVVKVHASTAPSGNTVTLDALHLPLKAHDIGETAVRLQQIDAGAVHSDGVTLAYEGDPTDIAAENQSFLFAQKTGFLEISMGFGVLGYMVENLVLALGMLLSRITGSGTTAAPRELYIDLTDTDGAINEETDCCWRFTGVRKDRTVVEYTALACEIDPTAFALEFGRGANMKVPIRLRPTGGIVKRTWL